MGQCGIIVEVTLRLVAAARTRRVYHASYARLSDLSRALCRAAAATRLDYALGYALPADGGGWTYRWS